ncbi:MAG: hypothetical protein JO321_08940, partial [Solirubrobacterales bacterium]|nr:hypothetical protein [Solirubrobacterales bacterium]
RPHEMMRGYRFSFGYTVDGVDVVAQHRHPQRGASKVNAGAAATMMRGTEQA